MAAVQKVHSYHNNSTASRENSAQSEYNGSSSTRKNDRFDTDLHGNVNILLGGWVNRSQPEISHMLIQHKNLNKRSNDGRI